MKLTKPQIKAHEQACALLEKEVMTYEEKLFVYDNWYPAYGNQIGKIASFFTPLELAKTISMAMSESSVVDLCAGIGVLSFFNYHSAKIWSAKEVRTVCIEQNEDFVKVGKKLFPEATWICGDIQDEELIKSIGHFQTAVSNPPFGIIKTGDKAAKWHGYTGAEFELKAVAIAKQIADTGVFILPSGSVPFRCSGRIGRGGNDEQDFPKYNKFHKETGVILNMCIGIDTEEFKNDWKGTVVVPEIAEADFIYS